MQQAKDLLQKEKDPEMRELAKLELEELEPKRDALEAEIKEMLMPKDPNDYKNCILEIRAGTGGDEAAIFAGDLWRMYQRFCDRIGLKMSVLDVTEGTAGGYKEVISSVEGDGAFGIFKYESGVHRVQRVPETETQGRVHTSAASVVVLPEAEDVDVEINPADIEVITSRSGGDESADDAQADRYCNYMSGRALAAWQPCTRDGDAPCQALRIRIREKECGHHGIA
jgi:peptide chain release factor 1